jgi:hypothetical protein
MAAGELASEAGCDPAQGYKVHGAEAWINRGRGRSLGLAAPEQAVEAANAEASIIVRFHKAAVMAALAWLAMMF